jgi:hypothetical protein
MAPLFASQGGGSVKGFGRKFGGPSFIPFSQNFDYTGNVQTLVVPYTGKYKLEAWGAQGGTGESYTISRGGYASGELNLTAGQTIYVFVGSQGEYMTYGGSTHSTAVSRNGGWNGGGGNFNSAASFGTGGGATDFALTTSSMTLTDYSYRRTEASYLSRILVAGGGGGNGNWQTGVYAGGGASGIGSYPGTQTSGGTGHSGAGTVTSGYFGYGGRGNGSSGGGNGGGGGWYGGGAGVGGSNGGGGGSGYVLTSSSNKPSGYTPTSNFWMNNESLIDGNSIIPNPSGGTMTGKSGNGYARITRIEV